MIFKPPHILAFVTNNFFEMWCFSSKNFTNSGNTRICLLLILLACDLLFLPVMDKSKSFFNFHTKISGYSNYSRLNHNKNSGGAVPTSRNMMKSADKEKEEERRQGKGGRARTRNRRKSPSRQMRRLTQYSSTVPSRTYRQ